MPWGQLCGPLANSGCLQPGTDSRQAIAYPENHSAFQPDLLAKFNAALYKVLYSDPLIGSLSIYWSESVGTLISPVFRSIPLGKACRCAATLWQQRKGFLPGKKPRATSGFFACGSLALLVHTMRRSHHFISSFSSFSSFPSCSSFLSPSILVFRILPSSATFTSHILSPGHFRSSS